MLAVVGMPFCNADCVPSYLLSEKITLKSSASCCVELLSGAASVPTTRDLTFAIVGMRHMRQYWPAASIAVVTAM